MGKRIICVLVMAIFFLGFFCLGKSQAQTRLLIGTGGLAGVYYPIGGAIAKIITNKVKGIEATVQTSAAGMENLRLLSKSEPSKIAGFLMFAH